jgi:hypothetical protein
MNTYTKGPWKAYFYANDSRGRIVATIGANDGCNRICEISPIALPEKEVEANARLIASAPDLLAALVGMMNRYGDKLKHPTCDASISARAAIHKAEGNA